MKLEKKFRCELMTESAEETRSLGEKLGEHLSPGDHIALSGELGSGKTVLVQGLALGLGVKDPEDVHSPTFALLREHRGKVPLCHADLYRLDAAHTRGLGLEDYLMHGSGWVTAVEWAERMADWMPEGALHVRFESLSEEERRIIFEGNEHWRKVFKPWIQQFKRS